MFRDDLINLDLQEGWAALVLVFATFRKDYLLNILV